MPGPYLFEPDTNITLVNVPWDSTYHNVVGWTSQNQKEQYFANKVTLGLAYQFTQSTYCPQGMPIVIDLPYSECWKYNYIIVDNPGQVDPEPAHGRKWYYFITSCDYVNPASSRLRIQLDVWTTFYEGQNMFAQAYIEQGHIAQADSKTVLAPSGTTFRALNTYLSANEGLDVGSEMFIADSENFSLQTDYSSSELVQDDKVIIMSTADLSSAFGTIDNPNLTTAQGSSILGMYSGCAVYVTDFSSVNYVLGQLQTHSWVAQCIISITACPYRLLAGHSLSDSNFNGQAPSSQGIYFKTFDYSQPSSSWLVNLGPDRQIKKSEIITGGFARNDIADLQKLWMYPYTTIEITTWDGNSLYLKPQDLWLDDTPIHGFACLVPPFMRVAIFPSYYAKSENSPDTYPIKFSNATTSASATLPNSDFLDSAVWITDFPQFSIVNNSYLTYMASTANQRAWSYDNASWQMASTSAGIANTYEQARMSIATQRTNFGITQENAQYQLGMGVAMSGVDRIAGGINQAISQQQLPPGMAIAAGASTAVNALAFAANTGLSYMALGHEQTAQRNILENDLAMNTRIADMNMNLASYVNEGNYANAIAGIQAGYADAQLRPPSTAGQTGGNGFLYSNGLLFGFTIRYKRISPEAQLRIAQYFRRFGYRLNRYSYIPTNLNICKHFTYYKCTNVEILIGVELSEEWKDALRGIMCRGVTVWGDPYEIGAMDLSLIWDNTVKQSMVADYIL